MSTLYGKPTPQHLESVGFDTAILLLKRGHKLARTGWNGVGMYVVMQRGYPDGVPLNANTAQATGIREGTLTRFAPYLLMRTAQGDFVPWVASQTDLLSDDWEVITA